MRSLALAASLVWLCGCGTHGAKSPEADSSEQAAAAVRPTPPPSILDADKTAFDQLDKGAQAELRRAEALVNEGKLGEAIEALGCIIGQHPKASLAFLLRARANADIHHDADAFADYGMAISAAPQSAAPYAARGFFQLSHGNTAKALEDLNRAIELDPKDARPYNHRGMARVTTGEVKAALADFTTAIQLNPKFVNAYNNRSFAYARIDRRQEALADLDRAIELEPGTAPTYNNRGMIRLQGQEYERALADFSKAIQLDKNNPNYLANRRQAFFKLNRFAEAQADATRYDALMTLARLNEAVFRDRHSAKPYIARGDYFLDQGQADTAIANYDRALQLDSRQWRGYSQRARARIQKGQFQQAVDDATAAIAIEPRDEAFAARADAYRRLKDYAKAVADYDASKQFDGDVAETWMLHSQSLRQAGHVQDADQALRRANEFKALNGTAAK